MHEHGAPLNRHDCQPHYAAKYYGRWQVYNSATRKPWFAKRLARGCWTYCEYRWIKRPTERRRRKNISFPLIDHSEATPTNLWFNAHGKSHCQSVTKLWYTITFKGLAPNRSKFFYASMRLDRNQLRIWRQSTKDFKENNLNFFPKLFSQKLDSDVLELQSSALEPRHALA